MTLEEAEQRKREIRIAVYDDDDPENGTSIERKLWRDALTAISNGTCEDPQRLAATVVATSKWSFRRM